MTGPSHYREAERLLNGIDNLDLTDPEQQPLAAQNIAEAQVHATLALAAATGLAHSTGMPLRDHDEWVRVTAKGGAS